ncbi:unnamed protein product, partial [Staurois parvus]
VGVENTLESVGSKFHPTGFGGRNSAPLLVFGEIVYHHWSQWEEWCPIIGISGRNGAPSLVSVEGMVSHHWYPWKQWCPIICFSGRNSAPSLVSVGGIVPHL